MDRSWSQPTRRAARTFAGAALLLATTASMAAAQGLTYSLAPSARWIEWDESLGLQRSRLVGGAVNLGFGRYVGLSGYYHSADDVQTGFDATGLVGTDGAALQDQTLGLRKYGGNLTLAFGTGSIVPVLSGGGGILRFDPEAGDRSTQLSLDGGAGLRLFLGESLTGEVMVERSDFRMNRYQLARGYSEAAPLLEDTEGRTWENLSLRAGVGVQLGRRSLRGASELDDAFAQRYQSPFSGLSLAVEPLVGRLQYDDGTGLPDQDMRGVRAGLDFGSFFGLRGFYWQGTEDGFRNSVGMSVVGGEGQFALAAGPGLNPYLVTGVGRMRWDETFRTDGPIPQNRTSLVLGGGVDFNLGPRLRLTAGARDFILTSADLYRPSDLDGVARPDDLIHNWQFSGGLKLVVGGGGIRSAPAVPTAPVAVRDGGPQPAAAPAVPAEASRAPGAPAAPAPAVERVVDTVYVPAAAPTASPTIAPDSSRAPRFITLPILDHGEIYIRFGEPTRGVVSLASTDTTAGGVMPGATGATVDLSTLRRLIQEELAQHEGTVAERVVPEDAVRVEELRAMEERILERIQAVEAGPDAPIVVREDRSDRADAGVASTARRIHEVRPHAGLSVDPSAQIVAGVAADIGPLKPESPLRLVPAVTLGLGEGSPTTLLTLPLEYRAPLVLDEDRFAIQPFFAGGPSLFKQESFEAAITLQAGLLGRTGRNGLDVFAAFQGVDFFQNGRLLLGLRRTR